MSGTPLAQLGLSKIDKLCDAKFITKIIKTTKTDFALFVSKNNDLKNFLVGLEEQIEKTNDEYKEAIEEYISAIPEDVLKFRNDLKEMKRKEKVRKKEIERDALKAELKREMEAEKKKKELEEKMGIKHKDEAEPEPEPIHAKALSFKKPDPIPEKAIEETVKEIVDGKNYQKSMDLGEFFEFLKEVVKEDMLVIKSDQGRLNIRDLDLDEGIIRIKVE